MSGIDEGRFDNAPQWNGLPKTDAMELVNLNQAKEPKR